MYSFPQHILDPFIQFDNHVGLMLTPFPVSMPGIHFSAGSLIQAMVLGKSKDSGWTILADGIPVVARNHEVAHTVFPHINLGPFDILMPLQILFSSNKCILAATKVEVTDGPLAVTLPGVRVIGLNQACNDPFNLPTCMTFTYSTVLVGVSWLDLLIALALVVLDILIGKLLGWLSKKLGGMLNKALDRVFPGLRKTVFMAIMRRYNSVIRNNQELFLRPGETLARSGIMTFVKEGTQGFQSTALDVANEVMGKTLEQGVLAPALGMSGGGDLAERAVEGGIEGLFEGSQSLPCSP